MRAKKIILFACLCVLSAAAVFSQTSDSAVFAPFISRLTVEVRNNLIRLSWRDSQDVRGPVYVYRSERPFESTGPSGLERPVEVPYGVQSYIDEVVSAGTFYYFIAASDEQGRRYEMAIPLNNTISVAIQDFSEAPVISDGTTENQLPASVQTGLVSLEALLQGDAVIISFRVTGENKTGVLYRSVQPIRRTQDLLSAVIVQSGVQSPFVDYPVPGIPYYYAVVFEEDIARGQVSVVPGQNSTIAAVEVPEGTYRVGLPDRRTDLRSMPLPLISVYTAVPGGTGYTEVPIPGELSPEAAKAVGDLTRNSSGQKQAIQKQPRAFSQDLEGTSGGEEYTLKAIVRGPFSKRSWDQARDELIQFLSLPRSSQAEARARFYLGQTYYFLGQPREALFEFLLVQSHYEEEASEWIQATLADMLALERTP
ncbi:hypothetical protein [Breznakiella homolactica]|uniref:Tetratricopeptide repeat protein n=1 Tax=Breznakiella homolactica TaxID=2798577 RepID=A0A7T7XL64_9SPIR|nr:hypothetical protein [Breznakiella homolactica]QQO08288.1 hypothetical protein JFL75_15300 [Breznakiella homolactica]